MAVANEGGFYERITSTRKLSTSVWQFNLEDTQ